jgi:hypothetical protein
MYLLLLDLIRNPIRPNPVAVRYAIFYERGETLATQYSEAILDW